MKSPPLGPYPSDLQTQPDHLQLDIPNMPENPTGYYTESSGRQFGFSNSHHLVRGSPPPLETVNAGSVGQSSGPYVPPFQTQIYHTDSWEPMVDDNASQQAAILFDGLAGVPVRTAVSI